VELAASIFSVAGFKDSGKCFLSTWHHIPFTSHLQAMT